MRPRKKTNLIPRIKECESLMISKAERDDLCRKFQKSTQPLHLEIGCGKGGFICQTAKNHPEISFIAMEREANVIVSALELAREMELPNLRFVLDDADDCLESLFAKESLDCIYINFCDPWPKTRHAKRRLTHRSRIEKYRNLLRPAGELRFKSDNRPLYHFSVGEFDAVLPPYFITEDLHKSHFASENIMTEYEQRFSELGQPIYCIRARKESNGFAEKDV